ncbi:MAG: hypothetical protein JWQ71_1100 [Pedosphaera sp.]|nr:hypothetical protein [Pedosphaera sp.]
MNYSPARTALPKAGANWSRKAIYSFLIASIFCLLAKVSAAEITHISATKNQITISGKASHELLSIAELAPYQSANNLSEAPVVAQTTSKGSFKIKIPRWDGPRDRLYSGFLPFTISTNSARMPQGNIRFVEEMHAIAKYNEPFPKTASKKGLQVQMVDDAIALGVKHAALNIDLARMVDLNNRPDNPTWELDGQTYHFHRHYLEAFDRKIKPLSDAGMTVTLILLYYQSGDAALDHIMLHPNFDPATPGHLTAFNTSTADGLRYFKACIEFLTDRYSRPDHSHGRAVNFIVGNEVNSHWYWYNLGRTSMDKFADDYLRTVRICNTAVHKISANARVYLSLEHHWNISMEPDTQRTFSGRAFIDYFNQHAKAGGDFDWHLAFHPYPEDLNEPRTWNDKSATLNEDTPRITFKNLEMLPRYFQRPELRYHHDPRHIILSEQGFNTPNKPDGELWQAAAYCYAYYRVANLPGIDAFILHRHVDHGQEFGLKLGLWRRNETTNTNEAASKKRIYEPFRLADTPEWQRAFEFALPIIGIKRWEEIKPKRF